MLDGVLRVERSESEAGERSIAIPPLLLAALSERYKTSPYKADDQFVFMQNAEPGGLYCADETDGESLRVCNQMMESLYQYKIGGTEAIPALAESCDPNTELTEWTCKLRSGVTFHDGSALDANDVVLSYAVQWDAKNPLHKGRQGTFDYFSALFGGFLNPPPAA